MFKRHPEYRYGLNVKSRIPSYNDRLKNIEHNKALEKIKLLNSNYDNEHPLNMTLQPLRPPIQPPKNEIKLEPIKKGNHRILDKDMRPSIQNKTRSELIQDDADAEMDAVDEKVLKEEMRKKRPGEALYDKLVKKKKKKALPKSVKKRIKFLKDLQDRNKDVPMNVIDAIQKM